MEIFKNIRAEFPILNQKIGKYPLVYLDNGATTHKPKVVIDAINEFYTMDNSNIHRGAHSLAFRSTEKFEKARINISQFVNSKSSNEIIFTSGTTHSINLIANSFGSAKFQRGDNIILSAMEHHSNIVPWQMIAEKKGVEIRVIPINSKGELLIDEYKKLIDNKTKIVSVAYVSNVLGTINPIKEIIEIAHDNGAHILIDAAQAVQHIAIDVQELDCDFLVFSGHKMYAPTGIGVLYGKEELLTSLPPYMGGGEMIESVSWEKTTFNKIPYKFEAGTPNICGVIALSAAVDFIREIGIKNIYQYEKNLLQYAEEKIRTIDGITVYGEASNKSSVISFLVDGIHHLDLGTILDKFGIAIRTGTHCAEPLMKTIGITGTARLSIALYNTFEEIDLFIDALIKAKKMLLR